MGSGAGRPVRRGGGAAREARYPGAEPGLLGEAWRPRGEAAPAGRAGKPAGRCRRLVVFACRGSGAARPPSSSGAGKVDASSARVRGAGLCLSSSRAARTTAVSRLPGGDPSVFTAPPSGSAWSPQGAPMLGKEEPLPLPGVKSVGCPVEPDLALAWQGAGVGRQGPLPGLGWVPRQLQGLRPRLPGFLPTDR